MLKPKPVDLILFDFDGTLADSLPAAIAAIQQMIHKLKLPYKTEEEIRAHIGFGERPLVEGSIGAQNPDMVESAVQEYFKNVENNTKLVRLFPRVQQTLEHFKDKTLIVISNKYERFIELIFDNLKVRHYFKEILGGENSPCLKPDPCAILGLLKKYQISPQRAIIVGDMDIDIQTGKNAGILTCGITYGFHSREELQKLNPDFIIDNMLELTNLIV